MQLSQLASLQEFYLKTLDGKGTLHEWEASQFDSEEWFLLSCCRFSGSCAKAKSITMNQGSFALGQ